jgi:hypothetical protein
MKLALRLAAATAMAMAASLADTAQEPKSPARTLNVAPTGQPRQEIEITAPATAKTSTVNTNLFSARKPGAAAANEPKEPTVTYGGFITDLRKSTNRARTFSLRRRANLKEDDTALIHNVRAEASPAVKLFSVDF